MFLVILALSLCLVTGLPISALEMNSVRHRHYSSSDDEDGDSDSSEHASLFSLQGQDSTDEISLSERGELESDRKKPLAGSRIRRRRRGSRQTIKLRQADFNSGPVYIDEDNSHIELHENIEFGKDFDLSGFFVPDESDDPSPLGFFAAIVVRADDVTINLKGHTLSQSPEYLRVQRFFALIEIGSKPFVPGEGPANFGVHKAVSGTTIHNGVLGASSHHGIHGIAVKNVHLYDLKIKHFEVAGIQFNGAHATKIERVDIGPSSKSVPFLGTFSNAVFLLPSLRHAVSSNPDFSVMFAGKPYHLRTILSDLVEEMRRPDSSDLFSNPSGLPTGSAVYGIVVHRVGNAAGDMQSGENLDDDTKVELRNVKVHDISGSIINYGISKSVKGPFGDVVDFNLVCDSNGILQGQGNVLFRAQLALAAVKVHAHESGFKGPFTVESTNTVLHWAAKASKTSVFEESWWDPICKGDVMEHSLKGSMGIRTEFSDSVVMKSVSVANVASRTQVTPPWCPEFVPLVTGVYSALHEEEQLQKIRLFNTGNSGLYLENISQVILEHVLTCGQQCKINLGEDKCLEGRAQDSKCSSHDYLEMRLGK